MDTKNPPRLVLGIETSCDDTTAALVRRRADGTGVILSDIRQSQNALHAAHGGVVPEIAARAHVACLDGIIAQAMEEGGAGFADLDGVAVAAGPGLIGAVIVGLVSAKAIALAHEKPLLALNHLEAHALTARLSDGVAFPYLLLLVSGGHTALVSVAGIGDYHLLGTTRDDALGEAFDKTARLLGLGFPGGPQIERLARAGDAASHALPRPFYGAAHCDFSFAGLKSAVRRLVEEGVPPGDAQEGGAADIAASFQQTAAACVRERTEAAMGAHEALCVGEGARRLVVAGGVAANGAIRAELALCAEARGYDFIAPPIDLCTDNGAMVAWAGAERLACGLISPLTARPRARWMLGKQE